MNITDINPEKLTQYSIEELGVMQDKLALKLDHMRVGYEMYKSLHGESASQTQKARQAITLHETMLEKVIEERDKKYKKLFPNLEPAEDPFFALAKFWTWVLKGFLKLFKRKKTG